MTEIDGTGDMRISEVASLTGLSPRYWQRQAAAGAVPGVTEITFGERRVFRFDREKFAAYWEQLKRPIEPCPKTQKTSGGAAKSGGTGSPTKGKRGKDHSTQNTLAQLKNTLRASARS